MALLDTAGEVLRIVTDTFAYLILDGTDEIVPFQIEIIDGYRGETFTEFGIEQGSRLEIIWDPVSKSLQSAKSPPRDSTRSVPKDGYSSRIPRSLGGEALRESKASSNQKLLNPDDKPARKINVTRAVNPEVRAFRKLVDCGALLPGDLLLSQSLSPDSISQLIEDVQVRGGYHKLDARWTHAAMYLGDGENVVEATFDNILAGGSVRITSLDEYCDGTYALRFRRSEDFGDEANGWRLCVRALSRMRQPYDFGHAAKLWWDVCVRKTGFYVGKNRRVTSLAVICSTLYADAYNEAHGRRLGEVGGVCVPAWLSGTDEFFDVSVSWLEFD
jgi:hypothetical protein